MSGLALGLVVGWSAAIFFCAYVRYRDGCYRGGCGNRSVPNQLPTLAYIVTSQYRQTEQTIGPGVVAQADQELAQVQSRLADVGVDLDDPSQQFALLALYALVGSNAEQHGDRSGIAWLYAAGVAAAQRHEEGAPA